MGVLAAAIVGSCILTIVTGLLCVRLDEIFTVVDFMLF